jgi:hypothetical protein
MPYKLFPPGTRNGNRTVRVRGSWRGERFEFSSGLSDEGSARELAERFFRLFVESVDEEAGRRPEHLQLGSFEQWFLEHHRLEGNVIRRVGGAALSFFRQPTGYKSTKIRFGETTKSVLEHRMVYLLTNGELPRSIDHINGDRADNRPENLRAATPLSQAANRRQRRPDPAPEEPDVFGW